MLTSELVARHPLVYHVAAEESWPSIQQHGLLSTEALLDLHAVPTAERDRLLLQKRVESTTLSTPGVGVAVIRDQKPLKFIEQKIDPQSSLERFLASLNSRVYFAATHERLVRLLRAKEYRGTPQVILHVSTAGLVERYEREIELCRFNSGACTQLNHPVRGHDSWTPISDYPYDVYRKRHGPPNALVEVTVPHAVPDVLAFTERDEHITPARDPSVSGASGGR